MIKCLAFLAAMLISSTIGADATQSPSATSPIRRGLNILGNDPIWYDRNKSKFRDDYFAMIRRAGFDTVRINLHGFAFMDDKNKIDDRWIATLLGIVSLAEAAKLNIILDEHDYVTCAKDYDACRSRLSSFWGQVSELFKSHPDTIYFEILNEPRGAMTHQLWNSTLREILSTIRKTNPKRTIIVGPAESNNFKLLEKLDLPAEDQNILVTVHYYNPFKFTHQGSTWSTPSLEDKVGVSWGTPEDKTQVDKDFAAIAEWSRVTKRPVFLGEFGAFDKGDFKSRLAWTEAVARAAERNGFGWAYWQFSGGFSVYSLSEGQWIQPLLNALVPPDTKER